MTRILLIRHGESEANKINVFAGTSDFPLSEKGRLQAQLTAEYLKNEHIDAFYSSDRERAYETGCIIALPHHLPVKKCPELCEIDGGAWERMSFERIKDEYPALLRQWKNDLSSTCPPDGESYKHLARRVTEKANELVMQNPQKTICIATHATPIRALLCNWQNLKPQAVQEMGWVSNASVTEFTFENGTFTLIKKSFDDYMCGLSTSLDPSI